MNMRERVRLARRLFRQEDDELARRVLWGPERKLNSPHAEMPTTKRRLHRGRRDYRASAPQRTYRTPPLSRRPPDIPVWLITLLVALGAVVALTGFFAVALDRWPGLTGGFETRIVSQVGADGAPELIVRRDRGAQYVVPGTVNGVDVKFVLDTGATDVAIPPALAQRLKLRRGPKVEITTANDVIPGHMVILDEVSLGPLALKRVRGSVSEQFIGDEVLLGMSFLQHFDLSQRGRSLTLRAPARRSQHQN